LTMADDIKAQEFGEMRANMKICLHGIGELKDMLREHADLTRNNFRDLYKKHEVITRELSEKTDDEDFVKLKSTVDNAEGGVGVFKWIAGFGGFGGLAALLKAFWPS